MQAKKAIGGNHKNLMNDIMSNAGVMASQAAAGIGPHLGKLAKMAAKGDLFFTIGLPTGPAGRGHGLMKDKIIKLTREKKKLNYALGVGANGGRFLGLSFVEMKGGVKKRTTRMLQIDYWDNVGIGNPGRYNPHYHVQPVIGHHNYF